MAMGAMAFATSFSVMFAAKIVIGVVSAALLTAPASILADSVAPDRRARAIGIWMVGQYIGAAFGYLVGGLVFDALTRDPAFAHALIGELAPWRLCYLIFGVSACLLLPMLLVMREPSRKERRDTDLSLSAAARQLGTYRAFLVPFVIASIFQVLSDSSLRTWLPPALVRLYGQTPGEFGGWIGMAVLLGGMFGATAGGWLAGKARKRGDTMKIPAIAALVIGASTCLAIMPNVPMVIAFFTLGTIANSVLTTVTSAIVVMRLPNELRGLVSGIFILVSVGPGLALGSSLVPAMTGVLGGPQTLGLAMAMIGVPTALLAAFFFTRVRFDDAPLSGFDREQAGTSAIADEIAGAGIADPDTRHG